jgi:hypothetical protein
MTASELRHAVKQEIEENTPSPWWCLDHNHHLSNSYSLSPYSTNRQYYLFWVCPYSGCSVCIFIKLQPKIGSPESVQAKKIEIKVPFLWV